MAKRFLTAFLLFSAQIWGAGSFVYAQPPQLVEYETRVALPNSADSLFIDEVVFRWSIGDAVQTAYAQAIADGDSSFVVSAADLEDFSMKLDDSTPGVGGVYIDDIIIGTVPQNRTLGDVVWEYDLIAMELLAFQNTSVEVIASTSGLEYRVSSQSDFGSEYEVVTYPAGTANADKNWPDARDAAEAAGGRLAIIESAAEDQWLHDLVRAAGGRESWVGGLQTEEPEDGPEIWEWLDGSPIPLGQNESPYSNWLSGEPNNSGIEDFMAINLSGRFGWNDEGRLRNIGSYVIEYPGAIFISRYLDGVLDQRETEDEIDARTALVTALSIRNIPTPTGPGTILDIEVFELEGSNVVQEGPTNADVCFAPDPREILNGGGPPTFVERDLALSELAGTGNCAGPLDFPDEDYADWEELLGAIDLIVESRYRGYLGRLDGIEAVWLGIAVIRTGAEHDGPLGSVAFLESQVDYGDTPAEQTPGCDRPAAWRTVDLAGTVPNFGEVPNVEGNVMIPATVQCNRGWSMTRRTTHAFGLRLAEGDGPLPTEVEQINAQFFGLGATIASARSCANSQLIRDMQVNLRIAQIAVRRGQFQVGIDALEALAVAAYRDDDFTSGGVTGFNACPVENNFRGDLSGRGFAAAFTVHDRFLHLDDFVIYDPTDDPDVAEIFELIKPDLREDTEEE